MTLTKTINLPIEILQQLGALSEASKIIRDELKELTKDIRSRERELKREGLDAEDDAGFRELQRRKYLLEQKEAENKVLTDNRNRFLDARFAELDERLARVAGPIVGPNAASNLVQRFASTLPGYSQLVGLPAKVQNIALWAAEQGYVKPSTAVAVSETASGTLAMIGRATPYAAIAATAAVAFTVMNNLYKRQTAANEVSGQIASEILNLTRDNMGDSYTAAQAMTIIGESNRTAAMARSVALNTTSAWGRVTTWLGWAPPQDVVQASLAAFGQQEEFEKISLIMGDDWRSRNTLEALKRAPDFRWRYDRKKAEMYGTFAPLTMLAEDGWSNITGGSYRAAEDAITLAVLQDLQKIRTNTAMTIRKNIDEVLGESPESRMRYFSEMRVRNVDIAAGITRKYFSSQQWNKF